MSEIRLLH